MEYFFARLPVISRKVRKGSDMLLMFDFDGTLAKIAKTPKDARIKKSSKILLEKLSGLFNVAVISGRKLSELKAKVGLQDVIYAGNHGLEWQIGKNVKRVESSRATKGKLLPIKKLLQKIVLNYPGAFVEDKVFSLSVHYRKLDAKKAGELVRSAEKQIASAVKNNEFIITPAKKAIEIRPNVKWNKGEFAKFLVQYLGKNSNSGILTFYIGDDRTDEDAFNALRGGVTVRMGRQKESSAHYFIKPGEIDKLLIWFASLE
jgi:trehalose-phosphatase